MHALFESARGSPVRSLRVGGLGQLSVRHLVESDQGAVRALFARTADELSESAVAAIPALSSAVPKRAQGVSLGIFGLTGPGAPSPHLLGFGGLQQAANSAADDAMFSFALVVAPQVRGLGIGSALLRALIDEAARAGASTLIARTVPSNVAMLTIAQRSGLSQRRLPGPEPIILRATLEASVAGEIHASAATIKPHPTDRGDTTGTDTVPTRADQRVRDTSTQAN